MEASTALCADGRPPFPPIFAGGDEGLLARSVATALSDHERTLQALFKPLEQLLEEELVAIGANETAAAIAGAWEANAASLRSLLLPVPRAVQALPRACGGSSRHVCNTTRGSSSSSSNSSSSDHHGSSAQASSSSSSSHSSYSSGQMVIAHVARDWSSAGREARARTYAPVLRAIDALHRRTRRDGPLRILVPGAGAGRLAWELALRGHRVEANDVSPTMAVAARRLIAASAAASASVPPGAAAATDDAAASLLMTSALRLFPNAGCGGGLSSRASCLAEYHVVPSEAAPPRGAGRRRDERWHNAPACDAAARLTLRVGDWRADAAAGDQRDAMEEEVEEVEEEEEAEEAGGSPRPAASSSAQYDAVVTSYFVDTQPNPAAAVRTIRGLLRPGGAWINVGPLHWHDAVLGLLRMSLDELRALLRLHGFREASLARLGEVPYLGGRGGGGGDALRGSPPWRRLWRRAFRGGSGGARGSSSGGGAESHDVVFWAAEAVAR